MGQKQLVIGFACLVIFTIALTSFVYNWSIDNEASINLYQSSAYDGLNSSLRTSVDNYIQDASNSTTSLYRSEKSGTEGITTTVGGFKFGSDNTFNSTTQVFTTAFKNLFGSDSNFGLILTIVIATLVIVIALYAWKTLWGGSPD